MPSSDFFSSFSLCTSLPLHAAAAAAAPAAPLAVVPEPTKALWAGATASAPLHREEDGSPTAFVRLLQRPLSRPSTADRLVSAGRSSRRPVAPSTVVGLIILELLGVAAVRVLAIEGTNLVANDTPSTACCVLFSSASVTGGITAFAQVARHRVSFVEALLGVGGARCGLSPRGEVDTLALASRLPRIRCTCAPYSSCARGKYMWMGGARHMDFGLA